MSDCPTCGDGFDSERAMKVHHKLKHGESLSMEEADCVVCASVFEYYPSDKPGKYCPDCVDNPDVTWSPGALYGEENGMYGVEGEQHHNWEGGISHSDGRYKGKWLEIREDILERDDYECQICGVDDEELGQDPDVHHRIDIDDFNTFEEAHFEENLIALCRSCHLQVEHGSLECPEPHSSEDLLPSRPNE